MLSEETERQVISVIDIVRAEYQKTKRSMRRRLLWAFPASTFALAFILTLGMTNSYAESVWNWWYTLLLPGMLAILCHLTMAQEKKTHYYHLMTLPVSKRKLMAGKILWLGCAILLANSIIFVGGTIIAQTGKWYLFVSAIPMRILCPYLHILPNGLPAEVGDPLLDRGVVIPGICLSVLWFIFAAVFFLNRFEKREVN